MKRIITIIATGLLLTLLSLPALAIPFTNGDFNTGLSSWNDASVTGVVSAAGGTAILETGAGDDPYSAILVQGDDGSFFFDTPISLASDVSFLNFDVSFIDLGVDASETGASFFTDYLAVSLYDADDFTGDSDLFFDPGITSALTGYNSFSLDVSSLAGHNIALSFELSDQDDGYNSRVLLDNISFAAAVVSVPEPGTLALTGLGLMLFGLQSRKRRRTSQS